MRRPTLPRPSLPGRRDSAPSTPAAPPKPPAATPPTGTPATGTPARPTGPNERIDGLRAWLAQVDRKLGIRTYAIGAAAVLALAAGIVGIVIALSVQRNGATDAELAQVRDELAAVKQSATQQAQRTVRSLSDRLDQLESDVSGLTSDQKTTQHEISQIQADIQNLRNQVSTAQSSPPTAPPSTTPPTAPGQSPGQPSGGATSGP